MTNPRMVPLGLTRGRMVEQRKGISGQVQMTTTGASSAATCSRRSKAATSMSMLLVRAAAMIRRVVWSRETTAMRGGQGAERKPEPEEQLGKVWASSCGVGVAGA